MLVFIGVFIGTIGTAWFLLYRIGGKISEKNKDDNEFFKKYNSVTESERLTK